MARVAIRRPWISVVGSEPRAELGGLATQVSVAWLGLTFFLAAVAVSLYLVQVSSMATAGYELQKLEAVRDGWLARNEQLQYELAKRRSLPWVESQATGRLGLGRPAQQPAVIQMSSGLAARPGSQTATSSTSAPSYPSSGQERSAPARPHPGDPAVLVGVLGEWLAHLRGD